MSQAFPPSSTGKQAVVNPAASSASAPRKMTYAHIVKMHFPKKWLTDCDKSVIERVHWNKDGPPAYLTTRAHFSVEWESFRGLYLLLPSVLLGPPRSPLIVQHYYGIKGCIIPVGFQPQGEQHTFAFTLAGPVDEEGRRVFYVLSYSNCIEDMWLYRSPSFLSVAEFHALTRRTPVTFIEPVPGGKQALLDVYKEVGMYKPPPLWRHLVKASKA
ncbi:hypothetical protein B0H16DRAFT_1609065 [Mycena metata]|uniref:Uncharacterized protein n=1 Tax=Mycena metata TaxID=1033252 RepID=A0AAD7MIZ2_9AGAR|nr:hypothetical protein B0H16DRAFT_1609065 [Mycena metata]